MSGVSAAEAAASCVGTPAEHDLSSTIIPFLDPHLTGLLLEFLSQRGEALGYAPGDLAEASRANLARTDMIDLAVEKYGGADKAPAELTARRDTVVANLKRLTDLCEPLTAVLGDEAKVAALRAAAAGAGAATDEDAAAEASAAAAAAAGSEGGAGAAAVPSAPLTSAALIAAHPEVTEEMIRSLAELARQLYDCGKYAEASSNLLFFAELNGAGSDEELRVGALWGLLAAQIMQSSWEPALDTIHKLRDAIEAGAKRQVPALRQLQQRTWLMHWSLFVYFNHPAGRNLVVDQLFNSDKYLNAVQATSPHLLRYLATAIVTNKRRRTAAYALVRTIQQEAHTYTDPILEFMGSLYVQFNFERALEQIDICVDILKHDFWLTALADEFKENARVLVYETYCRIHSKISIDVLASKLSMKNEDAERWIVSLLRNSRLECSIDSADNTVVMGSTHSNSYQKLIERTKANQYRSFTIANSISKLQRQQEKAAEAAPSVLLGLDDGPVGV